VATAGGKRLCGYGIAGESTKNHGGVLRTHFNTKVGCGSRKNLASKGGNRASAAGQAA